MVLPITLKYAKSLCDKFGKSAKKVCNGERKINREHFQTKVKPKNAHLRAIQLPGSQDPFRLAGVWSSVGSGSEFAFAFVASKSVGVFVASPRPRSQHLRPGQQHLHPPWTVAGTGMGGGHTQAPPY